MKPGGDFADVEQLISTGLDHYLQWRLREAAQAFHQALWLDPSNEQARVYLKTTLGSPGQPAEPVVSLPANPPETAWDAGDRLQNDLVLSDDPEEQPPLLEQVARSQPPPAPPRPASHAVIEGLLNEARSFEARGDFTSALDRSEKVLALNPAQAEAVELQERCTQTLVQMYESRLGPKDGVPEVVTRPDEMIWLNLDHRAGFVLAQIDGQVTYDDLYAVCGMSTLDTARVLSQLLAQGIIRTRDRVGGRARGR